MPAAGWMDLPDPPRSLLGKGQPMPEYRDPVNYMVALPRFTTDTIRWGLKLLPLLTDQDGAAELRPLLQKSSRNSHGRASEGLASRP